MKRPGALWLLRHELRLGLRGLSGGSPYGPILIAVGAVVWTMISWVFAAPIAKILPPLPFPPSTGLLTALLVISAGLAASACLMLSQAITITVSQIYTRNDLSLLFSSPVKPWTVLVVRATSIAMQVCQTYVLLAGPAIVCLAVSHSPVWLFALVCIILLGVMSTGVGLLIVLWLFRTIGPKLTKTMAQIFSVIIGASIFLAFQAYNIGRSFDLLELPKRASSIIKDPDVLWLLPARAVLGEGTSLLLLALVSGAIFLVGVFLFSRHFVSDVASALSVGAVRKSRPGPTQPMMTNLTSTIFWKEVKLLRRDPLLITAVGMQLAFMAVYLVPLLFALTTLGGPDAEHIRYAALASGLTLFSANLAFSLTWISVSAEDCPDLIASAPVRSRDIDMAKARAALAPIVIVFTPLITGLVILSPTAGVCAGLGCTAATLSAVIIQLWRRTPARRSDFRKTSGSPNLTATLGQFLVTSCLSGAVAVAASGLPWLAIPLLLVGAAVLAALKPAASKTHLPRS